VAHTIEPAASGRSKCRGCGSQITKGELRFGERLPNPFADEGDMTLWFHLQCAAFKRPESLHEVAALLGEQQSALETIISLGIEHSSLPRIDGLEKAPSGRAKCRACEESIAKGDWRIKLVYFEDGMFNPSGTIHVTCAKEYFGTTDILDRLEYFADVDPQTLQEVAEMLG